MRHQPPARDSGRHPRDDRGQAVAVWCVMLAVLLFPLAGISVDLWHGIAVQRQLEAYAEDAAAAGASGIDVGRYRATGCVVLDDALALGLAQAQVASEPGTAALSRVDVAVAGDGGSITVSLSENVPLTLLRVFAGARSLTVAASATAEARGSASGAGCGVP